MTKRQHYRKAVIPSVLPDLLFYAPLTTDLLPIVGHDGSLTVKSSKSASTSNESLYLSAASSKIIWNVPAKSNTDLTFSVWIKKVSNRGCSYSFGAPHPSNTRYYGLMYQEHSSSAKWKLGTEYCNSFFVCDHNSFLTKTNSFVFLSFSIKYINSNTYSCKIYQNGIAIEEKTFTNNTWLGLDNCFYGIANGAGSNTMRAYYKHFSVFSLLSDTQVMDLYKKEGNPLA